MTSFFSAEGGPIWIKFRRLVQSDMSTAVMWSKSKPDVEFQYGGRLGEFSGISSQSHVSHCRVLPLGEFTVTIPEPHATLQGVRIPSGILKIVLCHILFFLFLMQFRLWRAGAFVSSPIHLFTPATIQNIVALLFSQQWGLSGIQLRISGEPASKVCKKRLGFIKINWLSE